ncbi:Alpha-actinin-like protein 1 [Leucoagaricus sp. SymC.cos]|nr:Alpha-actinin-like protein 1 [Leucoagaricus sp. SymC.cos]
MTSLVKDLSDGVRLIQLMEIMGDTSLGRYNKNPRMRVQKAENVNKALEFITSRGVKLTNIGPEDIIDGNLKLILGMIWTLILRFTIADISEEGLSAKEGLLLWCQRKTEPYKEVDVQDFSLSWSDGLALCALIHCHRPDLLDYDKLDKTDRHGNTRLAFQIAAEHLGIPQLLEVEDLCDAARPDERSVMTYVASYFHAFSTMHQAETVARRVVKFAELMQSVWVSRNDYERRARLFLTALQDVQDQWNTIVFDGTYNDAKQQSADFATYKKTTKREWVTEKQDIATLFGNIQTKLRTYSLREYAPPSGLTLADVDAAWKCLLDGEAKRSRYINAQIREIKESLRKKFAKIANDFEQRLYDISRELASIEGPLQSQHERVKEIETRIPNLSEALADVAAVDAECEAANVEENDYTILTHQDLAFELELVVHSISKKIAFIDNQSGVPVNEKCIEAYQNLKQVRKGRPVKYLIFSLKTPGFNEIILLKESADTDWEEFIKDLPENEPCYAVYDVEYETDDGRKQNKLVFINWAPDNSKIKAKMVFASSKDALKKSMDGLATEIQASDYSEVAQEGEYYDTLPGYHLF